MSAGSALKGVKVGSTAYPFDYAYLDNKPAAIPSTSGASGGDVLTYTLGVGIEWASPSSGGGDTIPACNTSGWVLTCDNGDLTWADPSSL